MPGMSEVRSLLWLLEGLNPWFIIHTALSLSLACFVGVTGQGVTVLLACAIISDETAATYVWGFQKLVEMTGWRSNGNQDGSGPCHNEVY